jgi:hypothetical protein
MDGGALAHDAKETQHLTACGAVVICWRRTLGEIRNAENIFIEISEEKGPFRRQNPTE